MKGITSYINEKLQISKNNIHVVDTIKINSKQELSKYISSKLVDNPEDLDLSNIQLSESIDSLDGLFNGKKIKTLDLSGWDVSNIENFSGMFSHCYNLEEIYGLEDWNFKDGTSFYKMFYGCKNLKKIEIYDWEVNNVKNLSYMFYDCINLDMQLKEWNINYDYSSTFNMCKNSKVVVIK